MTALLGLVCAAQLALQPAAAVEDPPYLAGRELLPTDPMNERFGLALGAAEIGPALYGSLSPELAATRGPFQFAFAVPLRFELFDASALDALNPASYDSLWANTGRFRSEDWGSLPASLRVVRYFAVDIKPAGLSVALLRTPTLTFGQGALMSRYRPRVSADADPLLALARLDRRVVAAQLFAGPLPDVHLVGARVDVAPLAESGLIDGDRLRAGAGLVMDTVTPIQLARRDNPADARPQVAVSTDRALVVAERARAFGVTGDASLDVWRAPGLTARLEAEVARLFLPADTAIRVAASEPALFVGGRALIDLGGDHALQLRGNVRALGAGFVTSYFDALYEADRLQLDPGHNPLTDRPLSDTKASWATREGLERRVGVAAEAGWRWRTVVRTLVAISDAVSIHDGAAAPDARALLLHIETDTGLLRAFATVQASHIADWSELVSDRNSRALLFIGARLEPTANLAVRFSLARMLQTKFHEDDFGPRSAPLSRGGGPVRYSSIGLAPTLVGSVELIGWWSL